MGEYKKGMTVKFLPDNKYYEIEDVEDDVAYLIDTDGSSLTAVAGELGKIKQQ